MKRTITVTFEVDPAEYDDVADSPTGLVGLVLNMLRAQADLPDDLTITVLGRTQVFPRWRDYP